VEQSLLVMIAFFETP